MLISNATLEYMLQTSGTECRAVVGTETLRFYGVFNATTRVEQDDTGNDVVLLGNTLTVSKVTADKLPKRATVVIGDDSWKVEDTIRQADGSLIQLVLVEL